MNLQPQYYGKHLFILSLFSYLAIVLGENNCLAQVKAVELGAVNWQRSLEKAQLESKNSGKPILILFQEVPGCMTCQNYGSKVLSHPLIVEAIESYFVPLAIFNNKGGEDKKVLDQFKEPSWNNPVVRIVDHHLLPLTLRLSANYSAIGLVEKINTALVKTQGKIPLWLKLLEEEMSAESQGTNKTYLGMYCFWSGEKYYGSLDGVVATKAGFVEGNEVVEIEFNPSKIKLEKLVEHGHKNGQADKIYGPAFQNKTLSSIPIRPMREFSPDKESKYYLYHSLYKYLPLTRLQSTRMNAMLANKQNPELYLSPRQLQLLDQIKKNPNQYKNNLIDKDIQTAWKSLGN
ncbi:MAG: thioredoxin family protein [Saprospiraceae bacterium]|nr:thioredoxin family protein [Saprospiraceae bacterium]